MCGMQRERAIAYTFILLYVRTHFTIREQYRLDGRNRNKSSKICILNRENVGFN